MRTLMAALTLSGLVVVAAEPHQQSGERAKALLAVLENPQCKDTALLAVRALFARVDTGWVALTERGPFEAAGIHPGMVWTAEMGGRKQGTVRLKGDFPKIVYEWTYSRDMVLGIGGTEDVSLVQNAEGRFGGWCDSPRYRPLVLTNWSNPSDPGGWHEMAQDSSLRETLFAAFHAGEDSVTTCSSDSEMPEPFNYGPNDLLVVARYGDSHGRQLIALQLDPSKYNCDGPSGPEWSYHWFLLSSDQTFIGEELEFVDAGDYDNDGSSETLFWHSGYDEDGYTLYYQDFKRRVDFWWKYH